METVTITAKVDRQGKKVILHGSKVAEHREDGDTFLVKAGDILQWKLLDKGGDKAADLEGSKLRIGSVVSPGAGLARQGADLETSGALISGTVTSDSRHGRYRDTRSRLVNPARAASPSPSSSGHWTRKVGLGHGRGRAERRIATPA